jgi:hypothetical protein
MSISKLKVTPSKVMSEGVAVELAEGAVELPDPDEPPAEREADPEADPETWTLRVLDWEAVELVL